MVDLIKGLGNFFKDQDDIYVSGNLLMYYKEGDPKKSISPDCFVVKGVPKMRRRTYKVWEEGKAPDVVIEVTSKKTQKNDLQRKMETYQNILKIKEYFLFDPLGEYLEPPLQGYRLTGEKYEPIELVKNRLLSAELGIEFERKQGFVELYLADSGLKILTLEEAVIDAVEKAVKAEEKALKAEEKAVVEAQERKKAEEKAAMEAEKRKSIEDELTQLRAQLLALKGA
jgi:Uma2 family endonuclease